MTHEERKTRALEILESKRRTISNRYIDFFMANCMVSGDKLLKRRVAVSQLTRLESLSVTEPDPIDDRARMRKLNTILMAKVYPTMNEVGSQGWYLSQYLTVIDKIQRIKTGDLNVVLLEILAE